MRHLSWRMVEDAAMDRANIVIVNYQAGNIRSVAKAIEKAGQAPVVTDDPETIRNADALVFPGQGANDPAMRALKEGGLVGPIRDFIENGKPFLGVCLGLQLLLESSEEGSEPGLGVIEGAVRRLPVGLKVPHMGWNQVELKSSHPVLENLPDASHFYFVHSYYADPSDSSLVGGVTSYGVDFCSVLAFDNVVATQFHPEKSGALGMRIYRSFVEAAISGGAARRWK